MSPLNFVYNNVSCPEKPIEERQNVHRASTMFIIQENWIKRKHTLAVKLTDAIFNDPNRNIFVSIVDECFLLLLIRRFCYVCDWNKERL